MTDADVERLLRAGVIRSVTADPQTALIELRTAFAHLQSAGALSASDPNGAFQLAYDAARKAIAAHMRANGYRVGSGKGAHTKIGQYASAAFDDDQLKPHTDAFDDLRTLRNQSEYAALLLDERDADDALRHARAIVHAVDRDLA